MQLETLVVLDDRRRIVSTREPNPSPGPGFLFVRGASTCAWAIRADVAEPVVIELNRLALEENPTEAWGDPLCHASRYESLLGGRIRSGPAFAFADQIRASGDSVVVTDEAELGHYFSGWVVGEIEAGRAPVMAVRNGGRAVCVCFCARRSAAAAEAGIETAPAFRGRGYASVAAMAWARQIRSEGSIPIYSTDWSNDASLAVARKLGLAPFAADFSIDI